MSFPEQPFGFVAGRWVRSIGDTPDDADRAPDYVPVETGTVVFTPQVTHRVAADGTGWAGIIKDRIPARLGERGQLIDAEGHDHLALAVGVYSVSYDFGSGRSWPSHYIEVRTEHTVDSPLWLPPIAPPPEGPMIENRVVTIPADGTDGQVLVWDGAGFTWDFPPEGPEGPPGEVTTAALAAALAGKVTGTGMTLRHDTSVGTRVLLDHPGGTTMVHGDTGWRTITSWDTEGIVTGAPLSASFRPVTGYTGYIGVRRINNTLFFTHLGLERLDTSTASVWATHSNPYGLRPELHTVIFPAVMTGVGGLMWRSDGGLTRLSGAMTGGNGALSTNVAVVVSTTVSDLWPTTLPGTPGLPS